MVAKYTPVGPKMTKVRTDKSSIDILLQFFSSSKLKTTFVQTFVRIHFKKKWCIKVSLHFFLLSSFTQWNVSIVIIKLWCFQEIHPQQIFESGKRWGKGQGSRHVWFCNQRHRHRPCQENTGLSHWYYHQQNYSRVRVLILCNFLILVLWIFHLRCKSFSQFSHHGPQRNIATMI